MSRRVVWVVVAALTVLLLGPALGRGYVLTYDMVFVPEQSLVPAALGLADFLPRAVPQDAVLAVLTHILPGSVWQHLMLLGVVAGAGLGAARLLRRQPVWVSAFGATLYLWSAYLVERLVLGSWPVLVAYALLPWLLSTSLAVRQGVGGASGRLVLLVGLASLSPSGGVLALAVAAPVSLLSRRAAPMTPRVILALGMGAVQLPWLVPWAMSPVRDVASSSGVAAFALRAEGPWGALVTALGTGGVWNADAVPGSRAAGLGLLTTTIVVALAMFGARRLPPVIGRSGTLVLLVLSALGLGAAVAGSVSPADLSSGLTAVPGLSLLRDGHRWLAPFALLLALAAPLGAGRLAEGVTDRSVRRLVAGALVVLPVIAMPDAAFGAAGRLRAVEYPSDWQSVRAIVDDTPIEGDVVVLPWGTFRNFVWNGYRTVLDPAPRMLPRAAVVDDTLLVRTRDGRLLTVAGESARSATVRAALEAGQPLGETMRGIGAGLLLVERETAGSVPTSALSGLVPLFRGQSLELWAVPEGASPPTVPEATLRAVALAWSVALGVLVVAAAVAMPRRARSRTAATAERPIETHGI